MIINNIIRNNSLFVKGFLISGFLSLFMLFSNFSYSQTAEDEKNFQVCKACHTIGGGKLVGPDLQGVSEKRDEAWLIKFIQNSQAMVQAGDEEAVKVFNDNNKIPMPVNDLTHDQVRGVLLYISNGGKLAGGEVTATTETTTDEKTDLEVAEETTQLLVEMKRDGQRNMSYVFIIMAILFGISLFDLVIIHVVKAKWIHYIIMLTAIAIIGEIVFVEATSLGRQQYYQPDQPIEFSHKVHADKIKLIVNTVTLLLIRVCTQGFHLLKHV